MKLPTLLFTLIALVVLLAAHSVKGLPLATRNANAKRTSPLAAVSGIPSPVAAISKRDFILGYSSELVGGLEERHGI
jgi:hypothetical protein